MLYSLLQGSLNYEFEDLDAIFTGALDSLISRSAISVEKPDSLKKQQQNRWDMTLNQLLQVLLMNS